MKLMWNLKTTRFQEFDAQFIIEEFYHSHTRTRNFKIESTLKN